MRRLTLAAGLVGSPLSLLAYFVIYPAYGKVHGDDVAHAISSAQTQTQIADLFAYAAVFLAVPATLAFMLVLRPRSPKLAAVGGSLSILGWVALAGALTLDLVAVEIGDQPTLFQRVYENPGVVVLNSLAGLHILGGVLIGVGLVRTRVLARPLALAMTAAPVVHLASNLAGLLSLDALTWLVTALGGAVIAGRLKPDIRSESVGSFIAVEDAPAHVVLHQGLEPRTR